MRRGRTWIRVGMGVAVLLVLVGCGVPANPPVVAEPTWDRPQTRTLFFRACGDCHSNATVWPWYSRLPLVSALVVRDVQEGRQKLNVSEWGLREQETEDVAEVIRNGTMPPALYLPLHPQARLSAAEKEALIQGLERTFGAAGEGVGEYEAEESDDETDEGD
ncbi:heme-binding domain-containing protein [uncultured Thermanaerothrix sp.]|uniref:heme-binding domain-containing protein n=1 Tax=uncultured Thermanaerothrix sp. TaxID=1195149 RepID=UPI00260C9308|nr:heme-binding domain-containing protein [uncultured Thermanaerothrix sp.]